MKCKILTGTGYGIDKILEKIGANWKLKQNGNEHQQNYIAVQNI